ncbi:MAG: ZIP family metal transporter [Bacteroidota bacterium]
MDYAALFLAVIVGYAIAFFFRKKDFKQMSIILAFSGAFLLSVTLFELLPKVFEHPSKEIGVYIMSGILLQIMLDFFSKGAEHGHVHVHSKNKAFPWLLFISLSIHALLEGFPVTDNHNMLVGVIVHKIPIAIVLALVFNRAEYPKLISFVFLILFALMTPIGNVLAAEVAVLKNYETEINAVAIGVFLHVSTTILFESNKDHKFNLAKLVTIVLGVILAYLM